MGLEVGGVFYLPLLVGKMILPIPDKKKENLPQMVTLHSTEETPNKKCPECDPQNL